MSRFASPMPVRQEPAESHSPEGVSDAALRQTGRGLPVGRFRPSDTSRCLAAPNGAEVAGPTCASAEAAGILEFAGDLRGKVTAAPAPHYPTFNREGMRGMDVQCYAVLRRWLGRCWLCWCWCWCWWWQQRCVLAIIQTKPSKFKGVLFMLCVPHHRITSRLLGNIASTTSASKFGEPGTRRGGQAVAALPANTFANQVVLRLR